MLQELIEKKTGCNYLNLLSQNFWQIIVKKRATNCIMKNADWTVLLNIIY